MIRRPQIIEWLCICTVLLQPKWVSDLYVLDDASEGGGTHGPGPHQLHGLVEVPDVVGVHPQEGRVLQQDIAEARPLAPGFGEK